MPSTRDSSNSSATVGRVGQRHFRPVAPAPGGVDGRREPDPRLKRFADDLGLPPISAIVQYGRTPNGARFYIEFCDGRTASLGSARQLFNQDCFAQHLLVSVTIFPLRVSREHYWQLLDDLAGAKVVIEDHEIVDEIEFAA